jgi:uncharacterized membrane protein
MAYHNKVKVKILTGRHQGKVVKAEKAKNMNTEVWDHDPEPIYITNTEGEYQFSPREVEVLER